jgi:EAL domain-containing protein (putative c-di-GMP-specific phosphodiesterase class I)
MITAILTIAKQLGVGTVGEGVETEGEFMKLSELGCTHMQGYVIAKPMPATTFLNWAQKRKPHLLANAGQPKRA